MTFKTSFDADKDIWVFGVTGASIGQGTFRGKMFKEAKTSHVIGTESFDAIPYNHANANVVRNYGSRRVNPLDEFIRQYETQQAQRSNTGLAPLPDLIAYNTAYGGRGSLLHWNPNGEKPNGTIIEGQLDGRMNLFEITRQVVRRQKHNILASGKTPVYIAHFHSTMGADARVKKASENIDIFLSKFVAMLKQEFEIERLNFITSFVRALREDFTYQDLLNAKIQAFADNNKRDKVKILDYANSGISDVYHADKTHLNNPVYQDYIGPELWKAAFHSGIYGSPSQAKGGLNPLNEPMS